MISGKVFEADSDKARLVGEGVYQVTDSYVNWYLIEDGDALTVVDAGLSGSWISLVRVLASLDREVDAIRAVVLTHAHFDHVGFAERVRRELRIPVLCHRDEVPITQHPLVYPHERTMLPYISRPAVFGIMASFAWWGAFWPTPIESVVTFVDGDELAVPGAPRVIFTPGHTPGHCSLLLPSRGMLISGDALVTFNPYTAETGPQIVSQAANADIRQALRSLERIAETEARLLAPGHGPVWEQGPAQAVQLAVQKGIS